MPATRSLHRLLGGGHAFIGALALLLLLAPATSSSAELGASITTPTQTIAAPTRRAVKRDGSSIIGAQTKRRAVPSGSNEQVPRNPAESRAAAQVPQPPKPPLEISFSPQQVRIGEAVKFKVGLTRRLLDQVRPLPPLTIEFGDSTSEVLDNVTEISHRYSQAGTFKVSVRLRDQVAQRLTLADPVEVKVGTWSFTASPTSVELGQPVSFAVAQPSTDPSITYQFHFGDNSTTIAGTREAQATHRYHSPGTYRSLVDIRVMDGRAELVTSAAPVEITVLSPDALRLEVRPASASVDEGADVSFIGTFESRFYADDPNVRFNFIFGDTTSTGWQRDRTATHRYPAAGQYPAHVEVAWQNERLGEYTVLARSVDHRINVAAAISVAPQIPGDNKSRNGGQNWEQYLVFAVPALLVISLVGAFLGYRSWKSQFALKPEYVPRSDAGSGQVGQARLPIDFELIFAKESTSMHHQINKSGQAFVKFERITHD